MTELVGAKGKFTFRRQPKETGLASVARPYADVTIKIAGKECGYIEAPSVFGTNHWKVRLMIKEANEHCGWKWITFRLDFKNELEARQFVMTNQDRLQAKYPIHQLED